MYHAVGEAAPAPAHSDSLGMAKSKAASTTVLYLETVQNNEDRPDGKRRFRRTKEQLMMSEQGRVSEEGDYSVATELLYHIGDSSGKKSKMSWQLSQT